uniref:Uncharacterized protein n=1 Tax=Nelumbo nucifera TaxID=4432 RepID=A0A822XHK0_NELNU|nr:TPA_asm: hypothetical protein HUJ06_019758 [Nelumbo nucifera]
MGLFMAKTEKKNWFYKCPSGELHDYDFMWADNYTLDKPQVQIIEQHNSS